MKPDYRDIDMSEQDSISQATKQPVVALSSYPLQWQAALAGTIVALGLTFLFNLLTLGLGLSFFVKDQEGLKILTFSGLVWVLVGGYTVLFLAGWVVGKKLAFRPQVTMIDGVLYGFIAWTLYLILTLLLISLLAESTTLALFVNGFLNILAENTLISVDNSYSNEITNSQIAHTVGIATLSSFIIFAVGAIASCMGACWGIEKSKRGSFLFTSRIFK